MGKKAKIIAGLLCLLTVGCDDTIPPRPKITIEVKENKDKTSVILYCPNPLGMDTLEEITAIRSELEFVVKRLKEIEDQMAVKTDKPDSDK